MPKASEAGASNGKEQWWNEYYAREHGGDEQSPGTSSSTSGSGPDRSGTSGTTDLQSPAPSAESPSARDPQARPASSSVSSTGGSGQETGSSLVSPLDSSEVSAAPKEATPDQVLEAELDAPVPEPAVEPYAGLSGSEAMELARAEYERRNFDESERLLAVAESRGEDPDVIGRARGYLRDARNAATFGAPTLPAPSPEGPSEEDPSAGGFVAP